MPRSGFQTPHHSFRSGPGLLLAGFLALLTACGADARNVGEGGNSRQAASLGEAMLAAGDLDGTIATWEAILTPLALAMVTEGTWDASAEIVLVPDPCIEQRFAPLEHWGIRHRWSVEGCETSAGTARLRADEQGEVVWQPRPGGFGLRVEVPESRQRYSDGVEVSRTASASLQADRAAASTSPYAVTGQYEFAVGYEDSELGVASWAGKLRFVADGGNRFELGGEWAYERGGGRTEVELAGIILDYADCPVLNPDGLPLDGPPLMPTGGRARIFSGGEQLELSFGGCQATLLAEGSPVAFYDGREAAAQREYLLAFLGVIPGLYLLQRAWAGELSFALALRQWCDDEGVCHRFRPDFNPASLTLTGRELTAPTAGTAGSSSAGRYFVLRDRLFRLGLDGSPAVEYAAALTDTLTLTPVDGTASPVTWTPEFVPSVAASPGSAAPALPPILRPVGWPEWRPGSGVRSLGYESGRPAR